VRWIEMLAFSLYALQTTGSPLLVAMMTFARMLPMLLLSVPLTGLIEGRDRRRILMGAIFLIAAVEMGLLLAALTGRLTVSLLLLGSFLGGVFWTVEAPVRRIMLAEAGGVATASTSMGVEIALNQLTRLLGAVAGGLMIELLGLGGVFVAGLFLYAAALLLVGGVPRPRRLRPVARMGIGALLEGVRWVRRDRLLSGTVLVTIIFSLFAFPYVALAPVIGERALHLSPVGIGLLMGVEAGSGVVAAILVAFLARDEHYRRIYVAGPVLFVLGTLGLALAPTAGIAAGFLVLSGFGIAGFSAMQMVIPLLAAPQELRVRVVGVISTSIGVGPFGFLLAGLLAEELGAGVAQATISIAGLATMALTLWRYPELLSAARLAPRSVAAHLSTGPKDVPGGPRLGRQRSI
jgi:predicted MFS family arabinose efflux permease